MSPLDRGVGQSATLSLHQVHVNAPFRDDHAKVFSLCDFELALFQLEVQSVLSKDIQDLLYLFLVFCMILGKNENVIQVHQDLVGGNLILQNLVHHSLEGFRGVGEAKEHDEGFKESLIHMEGRLELISFLDANIVISPSNIQLGEPVSVLKVINEFRNEGERVFVGDSDLVQLPIVLDWSKRPILLLNKEEGRCHR